MRSLKNYCYPYLLGIILLLFDVGSAVPMPRYNSICNYTTYNKMDESSNDVDCTVDMKCTQDTTLDYKTGWPWVPLELALDFPNDTCHKADLAATLYYLSLWEELWFNAYISTLYLPSGGYDEFANGDGLWFGDKVIIIQIDSNIPDSTESVNAITVLPDAMGIGSINVVSTRNGTDDASFEGTDKTFKYCKLDVIKSGLRQIQDTLITPEMHPRSKLSRGKLDCTWISVCALVPNITARFIYHKVIK